MAARVLMPKGSDTMTEGKVLKWLKKQGDSVADGDALVEIETDKVNMEVEAMASGVLRKILLRPSRDAWRKTRGSKSRAWPGQDLEGESFDATSKAPAPRPRLAVFPGASRRSPGQNSATSRSPRCARLSPSAWRKA